jgi:hypothetical protein
MATAINEHGDIVVSPERLWKYRTWDERGYARRMIECGEIFFATVPSLNDPFEFQWREQYPTNPREQREFLEALCHRHFPYDTPRRRKQRREGYGHDLRRVLRGHDDGICRNLGEIDWGVFCASATNSNQVMWTHYSADHSGICVGIRTRRFDKLFHRVRYRPDAPTISVWEYVNDNVKLFAELSLTKSERWAYEEEWRTLDYPGAMSSPGVVDQVVIGARSTPEVRQEVIDCVRRAGYPIAVFDARFSEAGYQMEIIPVDLLHAP